jgi:LETM1-like protein
MGLNHFGTDGLLRYQLRNKIRTIKADDQMILWEGIDSLTLDELRKACAERGMRATGLTEVCLLVCRLFSFADLVFVFGLGGLSPSDASVA